MGILKSILFISLTFAVSSCEKSDVVDNKNEQENVEDKVEKTDFAAAANLAQESLQVQYWSTSQNYYNQDNQGHIGFNYWWNAHALDVLVDGYNRTKDPKYLTQMTALVEGMKKKNGNTYWNTFYDDMEWMALSCLRAYDATGDIFYKNLAIQLWGWIKLGWSDVNHGGIAWATGSPNSKNACSNGPAAIIAARLYQLDKNPDDLAWAIKIYTWLKTYLVHPQLGLVWDGYGNKDFGMILTYNQGTYIGAALELYLITGEKSYMNDILKNVNYILTDKEKFSPFGILRGENTGDGGLFKGIFIRYLSQLIMRGNLSTANRNNYANYIKINAESLINRATEMPEGIFGHDWRNKPLVKKVDSSVHLSGLMLLETADELTRLKLIN